MNNICPEEQSVLAVTIPGANAALSCVRDHFPGKSLPGVPPHITILYPWMFPALIDESVIGNLTSLFYEFPCFEFSLNLGRFGQEVLLLVPEEDSPFIRLTKAVLNRWPEYPYYGGEYTKIEPHISLAYGEKEELSKIAEQLSEFVPIKGAVTSVTLSTGKPGAMTDLATFPLKPNVYMESV